MLTTTTTTLSSAYPGVEPRNLWGLMPTVDKPPPEAKPPLNPGDEPTTMETDCERLQEATTEGEACACLASFPDNDWLLYMYVCMHSGLIVK